jgi:hypothetical protein
MTSTSSSSVPTLSFLMPPSMKNDHNLCWSNSMIQCFLANLEITCQILLYSSSLTESQKADPNKTKKMKEIELTLLFILHQQSKGELVDWVNHFFRFLLFEDQSDLRDQEDAMEAYTKLLSILDDHGIKANIQMDTLLKMEAGQPKDILQGPYLKYMVDENSTQRFVQNNILHGPSLWRDMTICPYQKIVDIYEMMKNIMLKFKNYTPYTCTTQDLEEAIRIGNRCPELFECRVNISPLICALLHFSDYKSRANKQDYEQLMTYVNLYHTIAQFGRVVRPSYPDAGFVYEVINWPESKLPTKLDQSFMYTRKLDNSWFINLKDVKKCSIEMQEINEETKDQDFAFNQMFNSLFQIKDDTNCSFKCIDPLPSVFLSFPANVREYNCIFQHIQITNIPSHFILQLNRFNTDERGKRFKLRHPILIPEKITLKPGIHLKNSRISIDYFLYAICVHNGDANRGHYYSLVKIQNKWFRCDDEKITQVNIDDCQDELSRGYYYCYSKSSNQNDTSLYHYRVKLMEKFKHNLFNNFQSFFSKHTMEEPGNNKINRSHIIEFLDHYLIVDKSSDDNLKKFFCLKKMIDIMITDILKERGFEIVYPWEEEELETKKHRTQEQEEEEEEANRQEQQQQQQQNISMEYYPNYAEDEEDRRIDYESQQEYNRKIEEHKRMEHLRSRYAKILLKQRESSNANEHHHSSSP